MALQTAIGAAVGIGGGLNRYLIYTSSESRQRYADDVQGSSALAQQTPGARQNIHPNISAEMLLCQLTAKAKSRLR